MHSMTVSLSMILSSLDTIGYEERPGSTPIVLFRVPRPRTRQESILHAVLESYDRTVEDFRREVELLQEEAELAEWEASVDAQLDGAELRPHSTPSLPPIPSQDELELLRRYFRHTTAAA